MPYFSIILPCYNAAKTLERCIDSILAQSFTDYELILVDDGSTDNTGTIAERYVEMDSRIVLLSQCNKGVSAARNKGLERAKGKWIVFADSDDYTLPGWLSGFTECNIQKGMMVVQNMEVSHENNGNSWTTYPVSLESGMISIEELISLAPWGYLPNKCFDASIISSFGLRLNETIHVYEDEAFVASYLKYTTFVIYSGVIGYHYNESLGFECKFITSGRYQEIINQYEIVANSNNVLRDSIIDRVVTNTIMINHYNVDGERLRIIQLKNVLGNNICNLKKRKLFPLRILGYMNLDFIWIFLLRLYSRYFYNLI